MNTDTVRLGDLFDPVAGVLPVGVLASDSIANSSQSFTNRVAYSWSDSPLRFNNQGQKWQPDVRPWGFPPAMTEYGGVKQVSTPRRMTITGLGSNIFFPHVHEFEILFTGQTLTYEFLNLGGNGTDGGWFSNEIQYGNDCQVYIEHGGRMWKAADLPKTSTRTDGSRSFRNMAFTDPQANIRIRFVGAGGFMVLATEASSVVAPAPPRPFVILDGDSYVESSQALTADSSTQWFTTGIADFLFERTGFAIARRGQGSTGFFSNGLGLTFDDTPGTFNNGIATVNAVTRWLSAGRKQWMTDAQGVMAALGKPAFVNYPGEDFGQPLGRRPLAYILNGTWNDASAGGVTKAQMKERAKECYQWVHSVDPNCTFVHVGPEPFDDTLFGAAIGPPTAGDKQDIHRQGQMEAATEVARTRYINLFGPTDPAWTGAGPDPVSGSQGVPTNSQQAQICSVHDGIHYTRVGGRYIANKAGDKLAEVRAPAPRVNGFA